MKLKYAALFLVFGALAELIDDVYNHIYTMIAYNMYDLEPIRWLYFFMNVLSCVGVGLVGLAVYRKKDLTSIRPAALFLAIVYGCWILLDLYNISEFMIKSGEWIANNKLSFLSFLLSMMIQVAILIFSLSIFRTGKLSRATWWLFAGGTVWLILLFFNRFEMLMTYGFDDKKAGFIVNELLRFLAVAYPIAMVVFALNLPDREVNEIAHLNSDNDNLLDEFPTETVTVSEEKTLALSTKQWLGIFLLSTIPLAGTVLLIIWASDLKNRVRGNWAAAMFLLQTLVLLLYTIAYIEPMAYLLNMRDLKFYMALFVLVFLITAIGMIAYRNNNRSLEDDEAPVPSIGKWVGNIFLAGLPVIGLILVIVWSGDKNDRIRRNWAIAQLIWVGVMLVYYFYAYLSFQDILEYNSRSTFGNF